MTQFHLVLTAPLGIGRRRAEVSAGTAPRHFLLELADALDGQLHEPRKGEAATPALIHWVLQTPPELAALAARVAREAGEDDMVFCMGEAVALPVARDLQRAGKRTRLVTFGHNLRRPRIRAADLLTGCLRRLDHVFVFTRGAITDPARYTLYSEQTDDRFFHPGAAKAAARPSIVSVGLERRDYVTLAAAVCGLDADIRVSAFSRDARQGGKTAPADPPPNWDMRFYAWPDLAALYRSADLVVIPLEPSTYAAGITTLLEAAASRCAVIASDTGGLRDAFCDPDAVDWVPPGDAAALRRAIEELLADPARRNALAGRAHIAQKTRHSLSMKVEEMAATLRKLAGNRD